MLKLGRLIFRYVQCEAADVLLIEQSFSLRSLLDDMWLCS